MNSMNVVLYIKSIQKEECFQGYFNINKNNNNNNTMIIIVTLYNKYNQERVNPFQVNNINKYSKSTVKIIFHLLKSTIPNTTPLSRLLYPSHSTQCFPLAPTSLLFYMRYKNCHSVTVPIPNSLLFH